MDDYVEYNDYEYCDDYEILPDSDAGMFITDGKGKIWLLSCDMLDESEIALYYGQERHQGKLWCPPWYFN